MRVRFCSRRGRSCTAATGAHIHGAPSRTLPCPPPVPYPLVAFPPRNASTGSAAADVTRDLPRWIVRGSRGYVIRSTTAKTLSLYASLFLSFSESSRVQSLCFWLLYNVKEKYPRTKPVGPGLGSTDDRENTSLRRRRRFGPVTG